MSGRRRARLLPAVLAAVVPFLLPPGGAEAATTAIHVRGRIQSPGGEGVAGQTVRLLMTRRSLTIGKFSSGGQVVEGARTTTDGLGFYEIRVERDRSFDDYFLRFYDPSTFDGVRYRLPGDREITREVRRGVTLQVDVTLAWQETWPEVRSCLEKVGADSARGRILLTLGLPEVRKRAEGPAGFREEWWYHSKGVVYFFREGEPAGYRRFEPVPVASAESEGN